MGETAKQSVLPRQPGGMGLRGTNKSPEESFYSSELSLQ